VFNGLVERGRTLCESNPDAGETLLNLFRDGFEAETLEEISPGLAHRHHEAWAGCRIVITPANPSVIRGKQLQLTATAVGMDPGFIWTLGDPGVAGSIDPTSGLYSAPNIAHAFYARATSTSNPERYKGVTIRVIEVGVQVQPATVTVDAGSTVSFSATVTNTTNTAVTWSLFNGGGTIDQQGRFTAGTTPGTYTVIATSVDDPLSLAFSTVTIRPVAVPVLQGRVTARMELHGAVTSTVEEWTVDLQVRNGMLVATGTFNVTETASFECGPITTRTVGTITGARFLTSPDPSQVSLQVDQVGERTRSGCGETTGPEPVGPMSGNTFFGTATRQNGRIVAIDFNYSESYDFPGSTGSYTQSGLLVER
jgi:plastocyanin